MKCSIWRAKHWMKMKIWKQWIKTKQRKTNANTNAEKEKNKEKKFNFTYSDALHKQAKRKSHRQCSVLVFDLDIFVYRFVCACVCVCVFILGVVRLLFVVFLFDAHEVENDSIPVIVCYSNSAIRLRYWISAKKKVIHIVIGIVLALSTISNVVTFLVVIFILNWFLISHFRFSLHSIFVHAIVMRSAFYATTFRFCLLSLEIFNR